MRDMIAQELLLIAKELMSMDFATKEEYDKYMKDHPDADKSKHHVVNNPAKSVKPPEKPSDKKDKTEEALKGGLQKWVDSYNNPKIGPTKRKQIEDMIDDRIFEQGLDAKKVYGK
jgi:hypothetical protein